MSGGAKMSYAQALAIYNEGKDSWCNPKKGTTEYDKVKEIQMSGRNPLPAKNKPARKRKGKSSSTSTSSVGVDASTQTAGGRMRAGRPRLINPNLVQPPPAVPIVPKPRGRPKKVVV